MAVNKFQSLGTVKSEFVDGSIQKADVPGTDLTIVVDATVKPSAGNLNDGTFTGKEGGPTGIFRGPNRDSRLLPPTVPISTPQPVGEIDPVPTTNPVSYETKTEPQAFSQESSTAPYETLFHEFELDATPYYNFWVEDEETNQTEDRAGRDLADLPRYVRLKWTPAPRIVSPLELAPSSKNFRPIEPARVGIENIKETGAVIDGASFAPKHLQPSGFPLVKRSLANGHVAPGVISAVVELPLTNVAPNGDLLQPPDQVIHIDEDAFLTNPDTRGISIYELKSNMREVSNGLLNTSWMSETPIKTETQKLKTELFDGNYSINRSLFSEGDMKMQGVQSSSPSLSLRSKVASSRVEGQFYDHVLEMAESVKEPDVITATPEKAFNRVKFANPAIDGVLSQDKINLMSEPHHAESMIAIAHSLPNLDILSRAGFSERLAKLDAPSFPSPEGLRPLEYIGYVIQKFREIGCGSYELVEEIDLPNREYDEYIDTKILYGYTYRYRIKAILRWTRPSEVDANGKDPFTLLQFGSQTEQLAPYRSSYFGSEWNESWAYATVWDIVPPPPPDEITVRPESARKRVSVSFKFPENIQRDIMNIIVLRKLQDEQGRDLTNWEQIGPNFGPQNGTIYDYDVDFFQKSGNRYVYTAQCISRHWEWSTYAEQISVRLNEKFKTFGEFPNTFVSCPGVRPEYFGAFSVSPPRRTKSEVIVVPEGDGSGKAATFNMRGRENFGNGMYDEKDYFVRVESLDTGESVDFNIRTTYENLIEKIMELPLASYMLTSNIAVKVAAQKNEVFKPAIFGKVGTSKEMLPGDRPSPKGETSSYDPPS